MWRRSSSRRRPDRVEAVVWPPVSFNDKRLSGFRPNDYAARTAGRERESRRTLVPDTNRRGPAGNNLPLCVAHYIAGVVCISNVQFKKSND
jgi:hypothetical protein